MTPEASWQAEFATLSPEQQSRVLAYIHSLKTSQTGPSTVINQGDIYWARVDKHLGPQKNLSHPHVVIQDNLFNHSRIETLIVCALTSRLSCVNEPGNLLIPAGEGNLPKTSVVVVSQLTSINRAELGEYIGSLSETRVSQILDGIRFQQRAFYRT